jgi:hypothetical protein
MKKKLFWIVACVLPFVLISCDKKNENEPERIYTKSIERNFSNEFEENLIEKAEAYYPSRDSIVEAADFQLEIPGSNYWFYSAFDGTLIPYAITKEAVDYYSGLIDQFNKNKSDNFFFMAEFYYSASVTFFENYQSPAENSRGEPVVPKEFESVYAVELILKWEQYCGPLCAMWIDKQRIAVFNEAGELIEVFLDGPISVPVS